MEDHRSSDSGDWEQPDLTGNATGTNEARGSWLVGVALLIVIATTAALGNWQLNRAAEKRDLQQQRDRARSAAPLTVLPQLVSAGSAAGRLAIAGGYWVNSRTIFIDNRTHNGIAGFHVVTPLVVSSLPLGTRPATAEKGLVHVLVLRGWIAANRLDRSILPVLPDDDEPIEVRGLVQTELAQTMQLSKDVVPGASDRLWQYFDMDKYRAWSGLQIQPFIMRQTSERDDGLIRQWTEPGAGVDRHLGYAFQWFAMSLACGLFAIWRYAIRRGRRSSC